MGYHIVLPLNEQRVKYICPVRIRHAHKLESSPPVAGIKTTISQLLRRFEFFSPRSHGAARWKSKRFPKTKMMHDGMKRRPRVVAHVCGQSSSAHLSHIHLCGFHLTLISQRVFGFLFSFAAKHLRWARTVGAWAIYLVDGDCLRFI